MKISDLKRELKEQHGMSRKEVLSNLFYLISQGWVGKHARTRVVPNNKGMQFPTTTDFYAITAFGIDKVEGPGAFTRSRFEGIHISASGQSVVTVGDGNVVNAKYEQEGEALSDLRLAVTESTEIAESVKMNVVANIDTIQAQLASSSPNVNVITSAWETIEPLRKLGAVASVVLDVGEKLADFLPN